MEQAENQKDIDLCKAIVEKYHADAVLDDQGNVILNLNIVFNKRETPEAEMEHARDVGVALTNLVFAMGGSDVKVANASLVYAGKAFMDEHGVSEPIEEASDTTSNVVAFKKTSV